MVFHWVNGFVDYIAIVRSPFRLGLEGPPFFKKAYAYKVASLANCPIEWMMFPWSATRPIGPRFIIHLDGHVAGPVWHMSFLKMADLSLIPSLSSGIYL